MEVKEADARYLVAVRRRPTEQGAFPADWAVIELATRATIQSGIAKNANAALRDPVAVPYLRVANVQDGYLDLREVALIEIERSDLSRYAVLPGDVLMNEGGDLDKLGRGALWLGQINPCVHQNHVFVVRCKTGLVPEYLNAWTSTAQARQYFMQAGRQTTNLASINKTSLGELTVAVPPTEHEQRQIAKAITDADALIDSLEQLLAKKRQIKQGAMQELLTGKRRLPGFTGAWISCLWGEVIDDCSSGATPLRSHPEYYRGSIRWISSGELNYNVIEETVEHISTEALEKTNLKIHPAGTFLMAITGLEAAGTRGACGIVGKPAATNQSCMAVYPSSKLLTAYLFHYYVYKGDELALRYCQGTKQQSYTAALIRVLPIDYPESTDEQVAIVQVLTDMDTDITALESRLTKARALKQAMAQALLTGRIRLVEPTA